MLSQLAILTELWAQMQVLQYPFSFLYVIAFNKAYGWHILLSHPRATCDLWPGPQASTTFNFIFHRWIFNRNFTSKLIWRIPGGTIPPGMSQYWLGLIAFLHWVKCLFPSDINWFGLISCQSWTGHALCRYCRDSSNFCWVVWLKTDAEWTLKYYDMS